MKGDGRGHAQHQERSHHDEHNGHHDPAIFKRQFFICLALTIPILYFSAQLQEWLGYEAIAFSGSNWISPILSIVIYFYGGWVFLRGAWSELHSKIGMMTPIALAITVAFVYSIAVSLGLPGMPFYWELATLVDIMLLGHWIEMASVAGASRALENLAEIVPTQAHRLQGSKIEDVPGA